MRRRSRALKAAQEASVVRVRRKRDWVILRIRNRLSKIKVNFQVVRMLLKLGSE